LTGGRSQTPERELVHSQAPQYGDELEGERVLETIWLPPRDSNPDNLLQRQVS
jgi:hypothetical protein